MVSDEASDEIHTSGKSGSAGSGWLKMVVQGQVSPRGSLSKDLGLSWGTFDSNFNPVHLVKNEPQLHTHTHTLHAIVDNKPGENRLIDLKAKTFVGITISK